MVHHLKKFAQSVRDYRIPRIPKHLSEGEKTRIRNEVRALNHRGPRWWIAGAGTVAIWSGILVGLWVRWHFAVSVRNVALMAGCMLAGFVVACVLAAVVGGSVARRNCFFVLRAHRLCVNCGYSLVGNMSGVCPECGVSVENDSEEPATSAGEWLIENSVDDLSLPKDGARQHDHYLYGTEKKT